MTVAVLNIVTIKTVYRKTLPSDNFAMMKTKTKHALVCYDKTDKK